jgi:hypothetical protein
VDDQLTKPRLGLALYAGGNQVFYCAGVLKYFIEKGLQFDVISTYSAGGAILPCLIIGDLDLAIRTFKLLTNANRKNVYIEHIFKKGEIFPHDTIYKTAIDIELCYDDFVHYDKEIRLIVSTFKTQALWVPAIGLTSFLIFFLYALTSKITKSFFLRLFKSFFRIKGEIYDLRKCKSKEEILNLILGSSTIYPFIKIRKNRTHNYMLDGKLSMLTPIGVLNDCSHVLSIHAHYTFPVSRENSYQIFPLKKVEIGPLDYVGSEHYLKAYEQGYSEAERHYESLTMTPFFH